MLYLPTNPAESGARCRRGVEWWLVVVYSQALGLGTCIRIECLSDLLPIDIDESSQYRDIRDCLRLDEVPAATAPKQPHGPRQDDCPFAPTSNELRAIIP